MLRGRAGDGGCRGPQENQDVFSNPGFPKLRSTRGLNAAMRPGASATALPDDDRLMCLPRSSMWFRAKPSS